MTTPTAAGSDAALDNDVRRVQYELALLFRRARSYARDAAARVHPEVTPAEFSVITQLVDIGPARAAELADLFTTDKAEISRQLSHLEGLGLVERIPDPSDRRALIVTATAEVRRRYLAAKQERRGRVMERLQRWEPEDVRLLADLLSRFNAAGS